mgnify:FL=1|jgi:hypothetical protein
MENNINNLNFKLKIVDNFLSADDYKKLCNIKIDKDIKKEFQVLHNEIDNNGVIKSDIDEQLLKTIHKNYHSKAIGILRELCPEKVELYDYSDFSIIVTSKNSKFPIHDDTPNKLLSGVIYLMPENNSGTIFYNNKAGIDKTEIKWKKNRAVFFSRKEKETWHSYEGNKEDNRIALIYNLNTRQIKKVYAIEKKNYFLGNLRWKLNPYLHRYLKIHI